MPRGGLSKDPEKARRQLEGLQRGATSAAEKLGARLTEVVSPANEPAKAKREKPGKETGDVETVTYPEPGKETPSRAKPRSSSRAKTSTKRRKPRKEAEPPAEPTRIGVAELERPFVDGLVAPFRRRF